MTPLGFLLIAILIALPIAWLVSEFRLIAGGTDAQSRLQVGAPMAARKAARDGARGGAFDPLTTAVLTRPRSS